MARPLVSLLQALPVSKDTDLMFLELVLRDASGLFYPISMLLSVFCHEVSHEYHTCLLA